MTVRLAKIFLVATLIAGITFGPFWQFFVVEKIKAASPATSDTVGKISVTTNTNLNANLEFNVNWIQKYISSRYINYKKVFLKLEDDKNNQAPGVTCSAIMNNTIPDDMKNLVNTVSSQSSMDLLSFKLPKSTFASKFGSKAYIGFSLIACAPDELLLAKSTGNMAQIDISGSTISNLGSAFDDANIDAYIACQIKIFDQNPPAGLTDAQKTEYKDSFTKFMNSFKNTASGDGRTLLKNLLNNNFTGDPLEIHTSDEVEESKISNDEFATLRSQYFLNTNMTGSYGVNQIVGTLSTESTQRLKEMDEMLSKISAKEAATITAHWIAVGGGAIAGGIIGGALSAGVGTAVGATAGAAFFNLMMKKASSSVTEKLTDGNEIKIAQLAKQINMVQYKAMFALAAAVKTSLTQYNSSKVCTASQAMTVTNAHAVNNAINTANAEIEKLKNVKAANKALTESDTCGGLSGNFSKIWNVMLCSMAASLHNLAVMALEKAVSLLKTYVGLTNNIEFKDPESQTTGN